MDIIIACLYLSIAILCAVLFTVTASGFFLVLGMGACLAIALACGIRVRVYAPWNNLGCLGVRVGHYYADVFIRPYLGMVVSTPSAVRWINLRGVRAKTRTPCALHVIRNSRGEW